MRKTILILSLLISSLLYFYFINVLTSKTHSLLSLHRFSLEAASLPDRILDFKKKILINSNELDKLYQSKLDKGIRNLTLFSNLLVCEADEARKKKEFPRAIELVTYAIKLSPDLPQPYFGFARILWYQNPFQVKNIFSQVLKGKIAQLSYYPTGLSLLYNGFYILSYAMLIALFVFGAILLMRSLPLYFYDIRINLKFKKSSILITGFKIFFLCIPFFLQFNILWALLFWSLLLLGYITKEERPFLLVFLILITYIPFFIKSASSFIDGSSSEVILAIHRANHEDWSKATEEELRSWLLIHPNDREVLFTLGLIAKREAHFQEAEDLFRKSIDIDPQWSGAHSNLGNVYLAQKKSKLAIDSYQKAIQLNSTRGAYYFNLYRAYSKETLLSDKGEKALSIARRLDPHLLKDYPIIDSLHFNRWVMDEFIDTNNLWKRFLVQLIGENGTFFFLSDAWFESISPRISFIHPILFVGFYLGMILYGRKGHFSNRCQMCGSVNSKLYSGGVEEGNVCISCYRIFIRKGKVQLMEMEKKSLEKKQHRRTDQLTERALSIFLVGAESLWRKKPFRGLLMLFIFFSFILKLLYWRGVIGSSFIYPALFPWGMIFWGGLFVLFYYLSFWKRSHHPPRFKIIK